MKNRGRNRNRGINPVWVVVNMRNSNRIYIVEFQKLC